MKLISHLPPVLRAVREYSALCETVEAELDLLRAQIEAVRRELVLSTAQDAGLSAWEAELLLAGDGSASERRAAILSRIGFLRPYTESALRTCLASLVGESGYTLSLSGRRVYATVSLEAKGARGAVESVLREVLPANVALTVEVKLTRNRELIGLSHRDLSQYTYEMIRNEVATNGANDIL